MTESGESNKGNDMTMPNPNSRILKNAMIASVDKGKPTKTIAKTGKGIVMLFVPKELIESKQFEADHLLDSSDLSHLSEAIVGGVGLPIPVEMIDEPPAGYGVIRLFVDDEKITHLTVLDVQNDLNLPWAAGDDKVWFKDLI